MFYIFNPGEIPNATLGILPPNVVQVFPRNEKPELTRGNEGWAMSVATIDPDNVWRFDWLIVEALESPPAPNPAAFYHTIQASSEFQKLDGWAVLNGAKPVATLLSRAMSVVLEAKAYADQFGGNVTNFDAVQARLGQFVATLDDTTDYGGTTKAEIITRIESAIALSHLPITPAFIEV